MELHIYNIYIYIYIYIYKNQCPLYSTSCATWTVRVKIVTWERSCLEARVNLKVIFKLMHVSCTGSEPWQALKN